MHPKTKYQPLTTPKLLCNLITPPTPIPQSTATTLLTAPPQPTPLPMKICLATTRLQPRQQRVGKQQRKSDFAEFKATFLTPAKVVNRHPVNIEDNIWEQLERIARILGERGTTVASYINAVLADHLRAYSPDIEIWRKL